MITNHRTSFTVYPEHCNYMQYEGKPMIHGGTMLLKMDRAAADCVRKLLRSSPHCKSARTVAVDNIKFNKGAALGDYLEIYCEISYLGIKSIEVEVSVSKEDGSKMAGGNFTFVSFFNDSPYPHGLKYDD